MYRSYIISCKNPDITLKHRVDISTLGKCDHSIMIVLTLELFLPLDMLDNKLNVKSIRKTIFTSNWKKTFENLCVNSKIQKLRPY